ncbi:thioredoxin family protein [Synechococcus sp. A18-25c]|uniref:glutaredoxin family protein n=1 Tax=unclassified Synechococcus TaxID=2626047 RepID=UPI00186148A1|nr:MULTISPECIES: glutaredoxin family protein [unclassified Synechococcus]MEC7248297.1 glutaredoxin family protein [Cyanobacteriota bacterium]MEC8096855.1 glutaredoxin family protein [Cyanobacteriota bacterium]QNI49246.1 thioredoxin family protein [Synechococcus sp. A15-60]QNJ20859.1 thioredoxin family protein [Synechococcus sp. A18-25c]
MQLTLFSRQGCCLCEGLEQRLRQLDLSQLRPPLQLTVIDIDAPGVEPELRARYDLEVPVLHLQDVPLPRVSPRLSAEGLFGWLQRLSPTSAGSN